MNLIRPIPNRKVDDGIRKNQRQNYENISTADFHDCYLFPYYAVNSKLRVLEFLLKTATFNFYHDFSRGCINLLQIIGAQHKIKVFLGVLHFIMSRPTTSLTRSQAYYEV